MRREILSSESFDKGFHSVFNPFNAPEGTLAEGSRNQLKLPSGWIPWKGLTSLGTNTGSRLMKQVGGSWGGLKDIGATQGKGSIFEDIGRSRWFIGAGQPHYEGVDMAGITASTSLKVAIAVNGVYDATHTYTAGLPQPSSPDVGIVQSIGLGYVGLINGPISVKIARLRLTTGARSVSSVTSAVINPVNQTVRVTFPLAATGQDYWAVFFTQSGFGGVGLHYRGAYQLALDIPESAVASTSVDGVARSLEFDFKDGDLIPEIAYIDDYVSPAGTHAVRLENVMCVLGAYADSVAAVSSTNPGTVGAISLPNYYESYKPRHQVYFPEQIVDVMSRPTDQYAYVGHRDCVTAMQYVGPRDGPATAVTMVWPDIGIKYPHNWCQVHGLLYAFQATGGPVRMMPDGSPDYSFANPVRHFMKSWTVDETIVGSHPDTLSVVWLNNGTALSYSLQTGEWSVECRFADVTFGQSTTGLDGQMTVGDNTLVSPLGNFPADVAGGAITVQGVDGFGGPLSGTITQWVNSHTVKVSFTSLANAPFQTYSYSSLTGGVGTALSCVNTIGRLIVSVNNGTSRIAYAWHEGSGVMPITTMSQWQRKGRPCTIMELGLGFDTDNSSGPLIISVHRNLRPAYSRTASININSNIIFVGENIFDANHVGDMVCLFGNGIYYLLGRISQIVSSAAIRIVNPATGLTLNSGATLNNAFVLIATQIDAYIIPRTGFQHTPPLDQFFVDEAQSYSLGFNLLTNGTSGGMVSADLRGTRSEMPVALVT